MKSLSSLLKCPSTIRTVVLAAALCAVFGYLTGRWTAPTPGGENVSAEQEHTMWTCSMHPQIKLPKPGKCPICFMDLIPLDTGSDDDGGPRELTVSENSAKLMDIETAPVERRFVTADIRMVGKVDYDETRVSYITAWVPGRLDRLFVDYTGIPVKKGDHMVVLYSPELLSAQEELLQAAKAARAMAGTKESVVRRSTEDTVIAAREKLRLLGLTPEQIEGIEEKGSTDDHVTIFAPAGGIVVGKNAQEGMYVKTGTRIYTIADLTKVWVNLNAYESDLAWLKYGQKVSFTTEAYPGDTFEGTVSFIHPVLNEATRTVKVRVTVPNDNARLKPGMFVRAVAQAKMATGGRIMDAYLAGKWISPMHPEVIKDGPGICDICGMPLVKAESLGYVDSEPTDTDKPLVIPASAALLTGKRAVVYVKLPNREKPSFEGRTVSLGPRAGQYYVVKSGLTEGEMVVTKGNFKIDAELQIQAKPSMMTPDTGTRDHMMEMTESMTDMASADVSPKFRKQIEALLMQYLKIQEALAKDSLSDASQASRSTVDALAKVEMELVEGQDHMAWMKHKQALKPLLDSMGDAADIEAARTDFALASEEVKALVIRFRPSPEEVYQFKCPMAFDGRGATWLQGDKETRNPYFGATMLKCGEVTETIRAAASDGGMQHD